MSNPDPAPHPDAGLAIGALILEIFRLNGRLLAAGDALVAGLGLSSARWQVLGAIAQAPTPQPVAWLARSMGLTRQGVRRIVGELAAEGLVQLAPNPHHRRASLVLLTDAGRASYAAAQRLQRPWVDALAEGLDPEAVVTAHELLAALRRRLEVEGPAGDVD